MDARDVVLLTALAVVVAGGMCWAIVAFAAVRTRRRQHPAGTPKAPDREH